MEKMVMHDTSITEITQGWQQKCNTNRASAVNGSVAWRQEDTWF